MKNYVIIFVCLISIVCYGSTVNAALLIQTVPQGGTGWGSLQANTLLTGNGTSKIATTSIGSGLSLSGGVLSSTGGGGDPFTHPAAGQSATTSELWVAGLLSTASSTFSYLGGGLVGSNSGRLYSFASSSLLSGYVPYTGATASLDLGGNTLSAAQVTSTGGILTLSTGSIEHTLGIYAFRNADVGEWFWNLNVNNLTDDRNVTVPDWSGQMFVGSTTSLYQSAIGNIGIGTTSPTSLLSVHGNQYTSGSAFFGGAITATSSITANSLSLTTALPVASGGTGLSTFGGTNHVLYTTTADNLSSEAALTYNASTDNLAFLFASSTSLSTSAGAWLATGSGNVGIGTTSPTGKLEVNAGSVSPLTLYGTSAGISYFHDFGSIAAFQRPTAATAQGREALTLDLKSSGDAADIFGPGINFSISDTGVSNSVIGSIGFIRNGSDTAGDFIVKQGTFTGVPATLFIVKSSGDVGIGTSTPFSTLDLAETTGGTITLSRIDTGLLASDTVGLINFLNNDVQLTTQYLFAQIEGQASALTHNTDAASGNLIFRTTGSTAAGSPTERMRIEYTGNVGVGTSNLTGAMLTVSSSTNVTNVGGANVLRIQGGSSAADETIEIGFHSSSQGNTVVSPVVIGSKLISATNNDTRNLYFATRNTTTAGDLPTERLTIVPNGNVGIGTTTPTSFITPTGAPVFDISSAAGAGSSVIALHDRDSSQESTLASNGAGYNFRVAGSATAANNLIAFATEETASQYTPTERMRIASDGKVGVGTSTPAYTFSTVGTFAVATTTNNGLPNFSIDASGHLVTSGAKPVVSSCGTSPTIDGNDTTWRLHAGSVLATSCTITFSRTFTTAPVCVVTQETGTAVAIVASSTPTTLVISGATFTSDWFVGHCEKYE